MPDRNLLVLETLIVSFSSVNIFFPRYICVDSRSFMAWQALLSSNPCYWAPLSSLCLLFCVLGIQIAQRLCFSCLGNRSYATVSLDFLTCSSLKDKVVNSLVFLEASECAPGTRGFVSSLNIYLPFFFLWTILVTLVVKALILQFCCLV